MTNSKELVHELTQRIQLDESPGEKNEIALLLLEHVSGMSRDTLRAGTAIEKKHGDWLARAIERINAYEPVQYVLGEAFFLGHRFLVNPAVLIPRPETEELVSWIGQYAAIHFKQNLHELKILDIGTGSGCIAISLAHLLKGASVFATDISEEALRTASANAKNLLVHVDFIKHSILDEPIALRNLDMVVSNPPYIEETEKFSMAKNVLDYEPHLALFGPSADPLLFYRRIAEESRQALRANGLVFVEINARFGNDVVQIFVDAGYSGVRIKTDINGKDRFVMALL